MKKIFRFYFRRIRRRVRKPKNNKKYLEYKEVARELVNSRLKFWNEHYKLKYGRVSIRNQRSRWGSCSSKRNLNFNYKITLLPSHLADYVIIHELCHLKVFNHSQTFWDLVAEKAPNYLELVSELKKTRIN